MKLGCPNCQQLRCKKHKVTPFSYWFRKTFAGHYRRIKWAIIALIKGENK